MSRRGEIARKMREGLSGVVVRGQERGAMGGKDGGGTPKGDVERIRKVGSYRRIYITRNLLTKNLHIPIYLSSIFRVKKH